MNWGSQELAVSYVFKINEKVYFSIKNLFTNYVKFQYQIDWGDNQKESGEFKSGEFSKVVAHSWTKEGDYLIQFKVIVENTTFDYQTYISIIPG